MSAKLTLFKHNCITKCHIRLYGRHFHTVSYLANIHELLMNMKTQSTPETARESLRHVKYREKFQGNLPAPGIIDLHVVGSGGRGNPKCVMISTPYQRYLFNCGESTQRIAQEHKIKLAKLENIFITHKSWDNIGGLLGLGLTLESINVPNFGIHGPPGVERVCHMVRGFAENSKIKFVKHDLSKKFFEDTSFKIEYVPLWKHDPQQRIEFIPDQPVIEEDDSDEEDCSPSQQKCEGQSEDTEEPSPKRLKTSKSDDQEMIVCYVCMPHVFPRKILIEKCAELGVPASAIMGKLKDGETVTLDNGTVVTPEEVLGPAEINRPIIVLECPSLDYVDKLVNSEPLKRHSCQTETDHTVADLVVHMTPAAVLTDPRYQAFIESYGPFCRHLILNEHASDVAHEGLYNIQAVLNLIHKDIFPILSHLNCAQSFKAEDSGNIIMGCTALRYQIRPRNGFQRNQCITLNSQKYINETLHLEGVQHELAALKERLPSIEDKDTSEHQEYPRLVFLGTGSSIPSKVRNVSGILLHCGPNSSMILDCGEGTAGQLYRHYGDRTDEILMNVAAIFVSHLHADHHLGLFEILLQRQKAFLAAGREATPILLLAPIQIRRWLELYEESIEPISHLISFTGLQHLLPHKLQLDDKKCKLILEKLQLSEFLPVEVDHCRNAFGLSITHQSGWKLVYSGDTMPCQRLVVAGQNCDLLIHEATMEDELAIDAKYKTHSTTSQAIDIGIQMEAKFILLNHFSQRYAKIPVFSERFNDRVGISFDHMSVRLKDLPLLPLFKSVLQKIFAEECEKMEERSWKKSKRRQLDRSKLNVMKL